MLISTKFDATVHKWVSALAQHSFDLTYRAGINCADTDILSRYPFECKEAEGMASMIIDDDMIKAVCAGA